MLKYRLYFDKDKASAWINKMGDEGWALKKFGAGFWSFERCEPGTYRFAVDFVGFPAEGRQEYKDFMESLDVTQIGRWGPWSVLRQPASQGQLQLYTDTASAIEQRRKILLFFGIASIIELLCFVILCLALPEMDWAWWAVLATAAAGAFVLIFANRCFQLKDDIIELRDGEDAGSTTMMASRRGRTFVAVGLVVVLAGLLLETGTVLPEGVAGFLTGFGVSFAGFGLMTLWLGR